MENGEDVQQVDARPDYWNPNHFKQGDKITYSGVSGSIKGYYSEGMWEIRLPSGSACVTGADIKRA
jgi:hypothetical protein